LKQIKTNKNVRTQQAFWKNGGMSDRPNSLNPLTVSDNPYFSVCFQPLLQAAIPLGAIQKEFKMKKLEY